MVLKTVCARCERVIREGDGHSEGISPGLCLTCLPDAHDVPVERLADIPPEGLDELPYGAIRLDVDGTVLAYNATEASLSRIPPEKVLGRNFFTHVAPCTNVQDLAGWLAAARREGRAAHKTVRFLFDLPPRRQYVRLALAFDNEKRMAHVLVDLIDSQDVPSGSP